MARGGKRVVPDGAYAPNRTDAGMDKYQSIQAAPGQPYGERKAQEDAMRAVPLTNSDGASQSLTNTSPPETPVPGQLGSLFDPSTRPDEPVTHGAASGPGAGPEALAMPGLPMGKTSDLLFAIASHANDPDLAALADRARQRGQ